MKAKRNRRRLPSILLAPEVAEVFRTVESTFNFAVIDQGKINSHDHAAEIPN
jgi:hypothetical protein